MPNQDPIDAEFEDEPTPPTFPYSPSVTPPTEEELRTITDPSHPPTSIPPHLDPATPSSQRPHATSARPIPSDHALVLIPKKYDDMPSDEKIKSALDNHRGLLFYAAKELGVTSTKLKRYINWKPALREYLTEIEGNTVDQAEATVHMHLDMGKLDAAKFYLTTKGKDRGYTTRQELMNPDGTPIHSPNQNPSIDLTTLTTEQLLALRDILRPPAPTTAPLPPSHDPNTPPPRQPAYQKTQSAPRR